MFLSLKVIFKWHPSENTLKVLHCQKIDGSIKEIDMDLLWFWIRTSETHIKNVTTYDSTGAAQGRDKHVKSFVASSSHTEVKTVTIVLTQKNTTLVSFSEAFCNSNTHTSNECPL